jgi:ribosomal protein S27AE
MRFTSSAARDAYTQIGLYAMRAPEKYWHVAARVEAHMRAKCGGRMFMAAHIRRGDCESSFSIYHVRRLIRYPVIRFGWTPDENLDTHVKLVRAKLKRGGKVLADIKAEYNGNAERTDTEIAKYEPPQDNDP